MFFQILKRFFYKFKLKIINLMVWVLCSFTFLYIVKIIHKLGRLIDMCVDMLIYFDQIENINIDLAKKLVLNFEIPFLGFLYFFICMVDWISDKYYSEGEIMYSGESIDDFLVVVEVFFIVCLLGDLTCRIIILVLESWL